MTIRSFKEIILNESKETWITVNGRHIKIDDSSIQSHVNDIKAVLDDVKSNKINGNVGVVKIAQLANKHGIKEIKDFIKDPKYKESPFSLLVNIGKLVKHI